MIWRSMRDYPKRGWVFVWFDDGLEYGQAMYGKLDIGGAHFDVLEARAWCEAPEPNGLIL